MNFQRVQAGLHVNAAVDELAANPGLWELFTLRQTAPGTPHQDTETIVLRGPKSITNESVFNDLEADWLPYVGALGAVSGVVIDALEALGPIDGLGRVMVVKLKPGGKITPHVDEGAYAAHYDRFHLVLDSQPGNWFICGAESIVMHTGELWQFNHHLQHSAANLSQSDRIHIIIDARLKRTKE